jgi:hypothetical protein
LFDHAKGACKDLPTEITALFVSFKPCKGGNNALWALNELANTPKHKMLIPIVIGGAALFISSEIYGSVTYEIPEWDSANNELVFLRTAPETKVSYNAHIAFSVALDNIEDVVRGQSPVAVLRIMANEVESVLVAAEAESRRIGLI